MFGAFAAGSAAGGHDSLAEAARCMAPAGADSHKPDSRNHAVYRELFAEYRRLHSYFGQGGNDIMKRLRQLRAPRPGEFA